MTQAATRVRCVLAFHLHGMTYFWKLSLLLLLLTKPEFIVAQSFSVNGYVEDSVSGERIPRVNLYLVAERAGTSTNDFGYFNLNVRPGPTKVSVSHVAYASQMLEWSVPSDTTLVILLEPHVATLDSIIVTTGLTGMDEGLQMSRHNLSATQIEALPAVLGEADVIELSNCCREPNRGVKDSVTSCPWGENGSKPDIT